MNEIKRILSYVRRAVDDYGMIKPNDKIAVGISGGKDSMTLLAGMAGLRRFYPIPFELCAITVDMGFEGMDFSPVAEYCRELGVEYHTVKSDIANVVFNIRKESNPCSLCAKMRRGALYGGARALGCSSVALGHHFDDAVDTFMMNLFHEGRLGCFSPVSFLSNTGINLIRPLIYAKEKSIKYFMSHSPEIPLVATTCPEDKHTERETIGNMLRELERTMPGLKHRIYTAMCKGEIDGFRLFGRMPE